MTVHTITAFGTRIQNPTEHEAGTVADLGDGDEQGA